MAYKKTAKQSSTKNDTDEEYSGQSEKEDEIAIPSDADSCIINSGSIISVGEKYTVQCLTIIGQIEGHYLLSPRDKTTKYEHIIPQLAAAEQSQQIDGLLIILNSVGGDVEAGLALAELISGMHAAFVVHRDLHAGNLLWQQAEKKWYLTDFQHARRGFCTRVQLEEDLTQLQHCLGKKVPVRTRVEFLKAYIWNFAVITETTETHSRRDYHSVWHEVAENLRGYDLAQARSRSRRAFKSNRDFAPIKVWNGGSGFMRKGESRVLVNDVCALLDKREWQNEKYITRFERKGNYCFAIYDHPQGKVAIEFEQTGFSFIEKLLPFKRKDRRIWRTAARLSLLHIPCERPLLIGRSARSLAYVYLVRGVFNFREAFQMAQNDPAKKEQLLIKLAKLAARMHNCGIVHGGFSCENLSVSEDGAVYIRDFKETRFSSNCSWFGRVDDLARLLASSGSALSYCEQRLFLRTYLGNLVEDVDARLLITDVAYKAVILSEENER